MGHKIYIASALDNFRRIVAIRDRLAANDISLTYDWTGHNNGSPYVEDDQAELKASIAENEMRGVVNAQLVLVVMPGGNGTHFEMGLARGLNKPIVLLLDKHTGRSPSFHFLPSVIRCHSEDDAMRVVIDTLQSSRLRALQAEHIRNKHA